MYGFLLVCYSNFVLKTHRFWDIWLQKMSWPWNPGQKSLKVIGTDTNRSATYDFLLTLHINHGPISHRYRDKRLFQSKIASFSHSRVFCTSLTGFPLELGISARDQKLEWWGYRAEQEVWRYLQPSRYNPPTWRTDRRTDTGRQQRPRLRITSRGLKSGKSGFDVV